MIEGPERRRQLLGVEVRQWHAGAAEGLQRRPLLRQAEQRSRLAIIAFQLVPADRPARMRHIVTLFEVDRVEFGAAPAPDGRGSAEEAKAAVLQTVIILADILAQGEVGDQLLVIEAAAFEQDHLPSGRAQAEREADPRARKSVV